MISTLIALPYEIARSPLAIAENRLSRRLPETAGPRVTLNRAIGSADKLAGTLLGNRAIAQRGADRLERSDKLVTAESPRAGGRHPPGGGPRGRRLRPPGGRAEAQGRPEARRIGSRGSRRRRGAGQAGGPGQGSEGGLGQEGSRLQACGGPHRRRRAAQGPRRLSGRRQEEGRPEQGEVRARPGPLDEEVGCRGPRRREPAQRARRDQEAAAQAGLSREARRQQASGLCGLPAT